MTMQACGNASKRVGYLLSRFVIGYWTLIASDHTTAYWIASGPNFISSQRIANALSTHFPAPNQTRFLLDVRENCKANRKKEEPPGFSSVYQQASGIVCPVSTKHRRYVFCAFFKGSVSPDWICP
jgi:hypothetical protein